MHVCTCIHCKSTNYNKNLMLTNLTNRKKHQLKTIVNKRSVCSKLYRPYLPREASASCLFEVSLRRWLRKTPTDSSSGPSEESCMGAAAKASFHNCYY